LGKSLRKRVPNRKRLRGNKCLKKGLKRRWLNSQICSMLKGIPLRIISKFGTFGRTPLKSPNNIGTPANELKFQKRLN